MATKAQAPAMPEAGRRAGSGGIRAPTGSTPLPRRGQVKEKIIKDVVAAVTTVATMAAALVRADKNGAGGPPAAGDADAK